MEDIKNSINSIFEALTLIERELASNDHPVRLEALKKVVKASEDALWSVVVVGLKGSR
jgi:hypothetical protein